MTTRPLIFTDRNPALVRTGKKTQTRREVRGTNSLVDGWPGRQLFEDLDFATAWVDPGPSPTGNSGPYLKANRIHGDTTHRVYSRIQIGDLLYVKEKFSAIDGRDGFEWQGPFPKTADPECLVVYAAGMSDFEESCCTNWRSPLFMPRWASRTMLEITDVRVERLQEITEKDCYAEGMVRIPRVFAGIKLAQYTFPESHIEYTSPFDCFGRTWNSVNGKGSWEANSWVWCYSFKVAEVRG